MYANTYRIFLLLLLILASIRMSTANAQIQIQTITDLQLKLPFRPGSEWQTTAGWDGANHQQAWNWNAVDFVPVGRSCLGESVLAAAPGKVINVAYHNPHHEIEIAHDVSPYRTLYAHLNTVTAFSEGQRVTYGTQIGTCGGYPNFVPHLHFLLFTGTWDASDGIIPIPIDGISDQNRLKSNQRGLYSTNGAPNVPPNIPTLVSPANGTTLGSRSVTLQWQDTGDPDNGPNTYRNYSGWVWNAANTWSQEIPWQNATSASITVPADGTYYWKVQSGDGAVGSSWTSTWSFTIINIPNPPSELIQTVAIHDILTISWKDNSDNETGFNIFKDGTLITTLPANTQQFTENFVVLLPPSSNVTYGVQALGSNGASNIATGSVKYCP